MQSISVVFHAHPTGMNISERELIWINNLKRKKICLMRTAYSEEEQNDDVKGTPYLTRNTPDKISPRMLQCSIVRGLRFPPTVRKYPQARPYSARAGLFFLLDSVKAQRWHYLRLSSPFGARLSSRF